jgi:uncharacterized membrane protein
MKYNEKLFYILFLITAVIAIASLTYFIGSLVGYAREMKEADLYYYNKYSEG